MQVSLSMVLPRGEQKQPPAKVAVFIVGAPLAKAMLGLRVRLTPAMSKPCPPALRPSLGFF
jgi:hypothetical protein